MSRPRWLLRMPAQDAGGLLFCIPYPGAGASIYHRWPRRIGELEVCPVQLPGRENRIREPSATDYCSIVAEMLSEIATVPDGRPFAFIGHCGTAFIGYEAVVQLAEACGPLPAHLIVSSMVPPHRAAWPAILRDDDAQIDAQVAALLQARGGALPAELVEMAKDLMSADVLAYRRYDRTDPLRLPCPITVIGWRRDELVPANEIGGWELFGDTKQVTLDGDHWSYLSAPAALLDVVRKSMAGSEISRQG
jgi:surfactin synthase thioesterase subunit